MSAKKSVMLRINVAGYKGDPATLFGAYSPETDVLAIVKIAKEYENTPREGFLKITNQDRDPSWDAIYSEEETRESILAFFEMDNLKLLNLKDDAQRCNPTSKIERDGMDESGLKFRFHPDITNQQVAVLAACLYAKRQRGVASMMDFADAMRIITI